MKLYNFLFIIFLLNCSLSSNSNSKNNIDINSVDFISLKKKLNATDSIYFLTQDEIKLVVNEWNNSKKEGLYKMVPNYHIRVHLKNDTIRSFRVNGELIKESGDWAYSLSNYNLISSLWDKAIVIPPPPPPPKFYSFNADSVCSLNEDARPKKNKQNNIIGKYYIDEFFRSYLTRNINLRVEKSKEEYFSYSFEFKENGTILFEDLTDFYICGNGVPFIECGKWRTKDDGLYELTFIGERHLESVFYTQSVYKLEKLVNKKKTLKLIGVNFNITEPYFP